MKNPLLFSIVIPVFNVCALEHKFRRCVESVRAQTWRDWELILVNDASTDATANVLQSLATADARIRILTNKENIRQGLSRNAGVAEAAGDYIFYCDHDDYMYPDVLQSTARIIGSHDRPELIQFSYARVHESEFNEFLSTPARKIFWWKRAVIVRKGDEILNRLLHGRISLMCWSRAVRADLAQRIKFSVMMPEDVLHSLDLCAQAHTVVEVRGIFHAQDTRSMEGNDVRQMLYESIFAWRHPISQMLFAHRVAQKFPGGHRVFCHRWVQFCTFLLDHFKHSDAEILAWGQMVDGMTVSLFGGMVHCLWRDMCRGHFSEGIKNFAKTRRYYRAYQSLRRTESLMENTVDNSTADSDSVAPDK